MRKHVQDLLAHAEWADAVFFRAWAKGDREDREIRERASHASGTNELFVKALTGTDDLPWDKIMKGEVKPPWAGREPRTFDELRSYSRSNHEGLRSFAAASSEADLEKKVTIPWFPDPPCVISVGEALVQAAMHSHHHRGQNITRLRQIGGEPKNADYIIWLWKGRPAAAWEGAVSTNA